MKEALSTANPQQEISFITDGNPSYQAALHFLNQSGDYSLDLKRVIGLQNLDKESEEYRHFKQIVERLNRTYKYHIRAANGFKCKNGAVALTTLIVTHYNFLRPHHTLKYNTPVPLDFLQGIDTLQGRWTKIINTSLSLMPCRNPPKFTLAAKGDFISIAFNVQPYPFFPFRVIPYIYEFAFHTITYDALTL